MAKKSRARASAKSKAVADILADIELIEEALSEAEQHAEDGADSASGGGVHGSTAGHGKGSASSAMERMANDASAHSQSRRGGSIQTVAQLLNTHNPHGWIRNAMNGNISGGTFVNLGQSIQQAGGNTLGSSIIGLGVRFAPHIFVARFVANKLMEAAYNANEMRANAMQTVAQLNSVEQSYATANRYRMSSSDLIGMRQRGADWENKLTQLGNTNSGVLGSIWSWIKETTVGGGRLASAEAQARIEQSNYIFNRENPWASQQSRDTLKLENLRKNEQVLKQFEVRTNSYASLMGSEGLRNAGLRFWRAIGDPFGMWTKAVTQAAESRRVQEAKTIVAHMKDNLKEFWENPVTGPVHRSQEMERTRWQDAVHEDHIARSLQWNSA